MTEIVNTATIKVVADATEVSAGLRPVEEAVARTGKNLENLSSTAQKTTKALETVGQGAGFERVGEGAGAAAAQVDRATARMADQIKRATQATESLSAGAKGTAANFAELANLRGLNVEALKPFLAQLDEAQRKTDLVAAAQRRLDDSTKFLGDLKSRTEGIGKSASELAALRAAELGVSDAAAPMIQKMREAEQAGESWFASLGEAGEKAKTVVLAIAAATAAAAAAGAAMVNSAINDLAELDDMAQKTGSSVESLSKIQKVVAVFGPGMEPVSSAIDKLAKGMATVDDESNKTHKALSALGISAKDTSGKLRDPSEVLVDLAKKLQGYNDGAGKTALVTDAIGKCGANLIPFLNDLAENYDKVTSVSKDAASAAAGLQDQFGWMKLRTKELFTSIAIQALPSLNNLAGAFLDVTNKQKGLIAVNGAQWAQDISIGLARVADVAALIPRIFETVSGSFKVVAADLSVLSAAAENANPITAAKKIFQGGNPLADFNKAVDARNKVLADANAKLDDLWNKPANNFEQALLKRIADQAKEAAKPASTTPTPDLPDLGYRSGNAKDDKSAEAAAKAAKEQAKLLDELSGLSGSFARDWEVLSKAYAKGTLSVEQLTAAQAALLAKQPAIKAANDAQVKALADEKKLYDDARAAVDREIAGIVSQAEAQELKVKTYGMLPDAITAVQIAELEASKQSQILTEEGLADIQRRIDGLTRLKDAQSMSQSQEADKKALDKMVQDAEKASEQIGQSLTDNIMKGGKSAAEYLKDLFRTLVLRPILSPVGNYVGATLTNALGINGGVQAGGGAGDGAASAISAAQTASSLYKLTSAAGGTISKIGDFFDSSSMSAFGSGFGMSGAQAAEASSAYGSAGMAETGSAITAGSSAATAASTAGAYAAGVMIGRTLGNSISSGYGVTGNSKAFVNWSTLLSPWAIGGGLMGGLVNRAFGMRDKEVTSQGVRGTLSANSLDAQNYVNWHQDGGWFRSDKNGTDTAALSDEVVKQFTQGLAAIESASSGFASSLGVSADWIKDYSKVFDIKTTGDATKDAQAITDFFNGIGDEIANKLVPNLVDLSKTGETAAVALERLANDFKGTDQAAQLLGFSADKVFGSAGLDSAKAREQLIEMAGGLSTLNEQAAFFNQNFLTDAERIAPVAAALDKALSSLGLSTIPATRDEFKELVNSLIESGAAATASGAKQLDSLLALGEAFAQVHPEAATKALDERKDLQDQLDELTMSSTQLLAKQRDAIAEVNRPLWDHIQALKAQAAAIEAVKSAATTLLGGVDDAYSVLQKVVQREKSVLQERIDKETEAVNRLKSLSDSIHSTLDSMKVPGTEAFSRQAAQSQIKGALAAVQGGAQLSDEQIKSLGKAFSTVTQDSTKLFGSRDDYMFDLLTTRNDIAQLGAVTDDQLSAEEKSLKELQDQSKALDATLAKAQEQIDLLKGISTIGLSIEQALQGLAGAIASAQQNSVVASGSAINGAYQQYLGRAPDQAGFDWWQNAAAGGTPTSQIVDGIKNSTEADLKKLYESVLGRAPDAEGLAFWMKAYGSTMDAAEREDFLKAAQAELDAKAAGKKIPGFGAGGLHGGGLRIVGENGPELEATGPSRIWTSNQTAALLARATNPSENSAALAETVRTLNATVATLKEANADMAKDMKTMAQALKDASPNGQFLRVKVVN